MIEETAVRVEISAARFASQSIFDILRLTVQAMSSQNYGQQSLSALNRQERPLASVDVNEKTLPYIRRQLKQYSVDFSVTKDRDTGQMYLCLRGRMWIVFRLPWKTALQSAAKNAQFRN